MQIIVNQDYPVKLYLVCQDQALDMLSTELAQYAVQEAGFQGKYKQVFSQLGPNSENVVVWGLGKADKLTQDKLTQAAYYLAKQVEKFKVKEASLVVPELAALEAEATILAISEGFFQATYNYHGYKKGSARQLALTNLSLKTDYEGAGDLVAFSQQLTQSVFLARDLVNTPANDLTPTDLADFVVDHFEDTSVEVEVFDQAALEDLGAKALLAVAQGSDQEPRMLVLKYLPQGSDQPAVGLVGKGVTYDSGGYALKPARSMETMKADMAGAAAVIATVDALQALGSQQNVYAVIVATENLVNGGALKNGDVISSLKGTSIEVNNTDAEGRLILADGLFYAADRLNTACLVDVATLTGAAANFFGDEITPIMSNDNDWAQDLLAAADQAGEIMTQVPLLDSYRNRIKGDIADISNMSKKGNGAGAQIAAVFLEHFVEDKPWAHLDIAGPAFISTPMSYYPKGATGVPVKTLYYLVENYAK